MATLTIRNVPEELHAALKKKARDNRRSVNQEVIAELSARLVNESEVRVQRMLSLAEELRKELSAPLTSEEIRAAIDEGRK